MKKILKLTSFLFFMIFSLNVHSQSEKLKELQQTLEDWENFSFELYVLKMDKDQVYSRLEGRKGSLIGISPSKGNSIDKPRGYYYTIRRYMPLIENFVTETKSMTIDSKYSKSEYEDHKKSMKETVLKQIDEQLEFEKKQKEVRIATALKKAEIKRKRDDYVKSQIELIENKKDSIIIEIDREKANLKRWNDRFTKISLELIPLLNFHEGDTIGNGFDSFKFSYGIDNSLLGFPSKKRWDAVYSFGFSFKNMIKIIPSFQIYKNIGLFKKEFDLILNYIYVDNQNIINSNSKSFDEVKDEWEGVTDRYYAKCNYCESNGLSDNIFNERLLRSYNYEIYKAKKKGYDYVYSPLVWKGEEMKSHNEKLDKAVNRFYANQNYIEPESSRQCLFADCMSVLLMDDLKLVSDYMQGSRMASKFLVWYKKVFPQGSETYRRRKVEKFLNCTRYPSLSSLINSPNIGSIFAFINEIVPTGMVGLLENIDYNKLNECLEELY